MVTKDGLRWNYLERSSNQKIILSSFVTRKLSSISFSKRRFTDHLLIPSCPRNDGCAKRWSVPKPVGAFVIPSGRLGEAGAIVLFSAIALLRNQFEANEPIFTPNVEQAV